MVDGADIPLLPLLIGSTLPNEDVVAEDLLHIAHTWFEVSTETKEPQIEYHPHRRPSTGTSPESARAR